MSEVNNKENNPGYKKINTRGSSIASKMLTIRNNEGKVCGQKTLAKKLTKKATKKGASR
jgi:hypothetical protein